MRGEMYDISYPNSDLDGEPAPPIKVSAVWVPDKGLLFQRSKKRGVVQVCAPDVFPPKDATVSLVGSCRVPYSVITAARKYLEERDRILAQEDVLEDALTRLGDRAVRNEGRFQPKAEDLFSD